MGSGVAAHEVADRVGYRLDEGGGYPDRQGDAERVPKAAGVLDDGPPIVARDPGGQHATPPGQFVEPLPDSLGR